MDETYGTYVDDECFDIHDYDDDTDHDTDDDTDDNTDDDTNDDADDDADDGGRGNLSRHEEAYWYTRILEQSYCPDINDHPTGHIDKINRYSDRSR